MRSGTRCNRAGLFGILILLLAASAHADVIQQVSEDLKSISGYIVAQKAGEFIIDLDGAAGVAPGDIFSIVRPGEPLTHPKTGKTLGRLDETTGLLKVTRVKTGYSHARPVGPVNGARGDAIQRFTQMPAVFWDYTGDGASMFQRLRDTLSDLNWGAYVSDQTNRPDPPVSLKDRHPLYFILTSAGLEIRDPEFQMFRRYTDAGVRIETPPVSTPASTPVSKPVVKSAPAPPPRAAPKPVETVAFAPEYQNFQRIDDLPGVVRMADFIRHENRLLMAVAEGNTVHVFQVSEGLSPVAKLETDARTSVCAVKWWRPETDARLHLAVTAWANESLRSAVYVLEQTSLQPLQTFIPYFLGSLDRNQDGSPETLLAQSFDRDTFWGRRIQEIRRTAKGIETAASTLALPPAFSVVAGTLADMTGDGVPERIFVQGKTLRIWSETEELFRLSGMGGSLSAITYAVNPGDQAVLTRTGALEIAPLVADVDNDGRNDIVAVAAARSPFALPGVYSGFSYSQLTVVTFKDGHFVQGTIGDEIDTPVQGVAVDQGRMLFVAARPETLTGKSGGSALNAYPLAR